MAAADAFGTVWEMSTDGGTIYNAIGQVTNIVPLDVSVDTIDTTAHDTAGQWRTFISSLKDGGELTMSVNYDPTAHEAIWNEIGQDDTMHRFTLTDAGAATVTVTAPITGFKATAPMDDLLTAEISMKVSGAPVIVT